MECTPILHNGRPEKLMGSISEDELLAQAILRLNGWILGTVFGILGGLVVFLATIWLVLKGGPVVGPHLSLLSQFFIGYSVTYTGSVIGAVYGFVCGFVAGWIIAFIYNKVAFFGRPS
jgi:hypothetical protein